jgi:hypothetical protein
MSSQQHVAILGSGNIGLSLAKGLVKSGLVGAAGNNAYAQKFRCYWPSIQRFGLSGHIK